MEHSNNNKKIETPVKDEEDGVEEMFGRDSTGSSADHESASHQHAGFLRMSRRVGN